MDAFLSFHPVRRPSVIGEARRIAALGSRGASWATVCQRQGLARGMLEHASHKTHIQPAPRDDRCLSLTLPQCAEGFFG